MGFHTDIVPAFRASGKRPLLAVAALAMLVSAGAALARAEGDSLVAPFTLAQADAPAATPASAERPRALRFESSARTMTVGVLQSARELMTTGSIPFAPGSWEVGAEAKRAIARLRGEFRANAPKDAAFALLVSGGDEVVAYRRARGLRTALIELQLEEAPRILIAARGAGEGQSGDDGQARVDLVPLDSARCDGCGDKPFRTVALDTGVAKLVRATSEDVTVAERAPVAESEEPASETASAPKQAPATMPTPVARPAAPAPKQAREERKAVSAPSPMPAPARAEAAPAEKTQERAPQRREMQARTERRERRTAMVERSQPSRRCARPAIVIDDYYRGGPLIGCDGRFRPRSDW